MIQFISAILILYCVATTCYLIYRIVQMDLKFPPKPFVSSAGKDLTTQGAQRACDLHSCSLVFFLSL